jgi:uncharacterized protein YbjQ (UPF0145 family)
MVWWKVNPMITWGSAKSEQAERLGSPAGTCVKVAGPRCGRESTLSVGGLQALRRVGFEQVGQAFGAAVFPLATTVGVSCPGIGGLRRASAEGAAMGPTIVSGDGVPGPAARFAHALSQGRRTAVSRMLAHCAELGGHGVVGVSVEVEEIPDAVLTAAAVEFTVMGTAVRAGGCPPPTRPFACEGSGPDLAKLIMAGWVPVAIVLGISATARHDDLHMADRYRWGLQNAEVAAYTDLIIKARHDARSRLEQDVREVGADGVVGSSMTVHVHSSPCHAHAGGTDHLAHAVATGTAVTRFADFPQASRSLVVLPLTHRR